MIFHEIYGTYYTIISQLLAQAAEGTLTKAQLYAVVREQGFAESSLTIPRHLLEQTWPLLQKDLTTPLRRRALSHRCWRSGGSRPCLPIPGSGSSTRPPRDWRISSPCIPGTRWSISTSISTGIPTRTPPTSPISGPF